MGVQKLANNLTKTQLRLLLLGLSLVYLLPFFFDYFAPLSLEAQDSDHYEIIEKSVYSLYGVLNDNILTLSFHLFHLLLLVFSILGLLSFKSWGRIFLLLATVAGLINHLGQTPKHWLGIDVFFFTLSSLTTGIVLAIVYFTPCSEQYDRGSSGYSLLFFLIIVIGIIHFALSNLQMDEPLEQGAASLLEKARVENENANKDTYYFYLGLLAHVGENPLQIGRSIANTTAQAEQKYINHLHEPTAIDEYIDTDWELCRLRLNFFNSNSPINCRLIEKNCLESLLLTDHNPLKNLTDPQRVFLERYRQFLTLEGYKTYHKDLYNTPLFIPFDYLLIGNRLILMELIQLANQSDLTLAIGNLEKHIKYLREKLQSADTLALKSTYIKSISDSIDVLSLLSSRKSTGFKTLVPLTQDEKSFEQVFVRMFDAELKETFGLIVLHVNYRFNNALLGKLFYKENMTANELYKPYTRLIELSLGTTQHFIDTISQPEFLKSKIDLEKAELSVFNNISKEQRETLSDDQFWDLILAEESNTPEMLFDFDTVTLRNVLGERVLSSRSFFEIQYIWEMFSLDAKIAIFNQIAQIKGSGETFTIDTIKNPFGQQYAVLNIENQRKICLEGPIFDRFKIGCLWIR